MKRYVFLFICLYSLNLAAQQTVSWQDLQANIDSWLKGPPSLILTDEEKDVYKKLKSPEEKMQFIKIFWARRDPILRTRANEFKEEFYQRVEYANQNFAEKNTEGWKTARGQVYVMFGAPSRVDHQTIPDSSRPALLWVYDSIPSNKIPRNEAMMFIWREFKYVLAPPGANPGDVFAERQQALDAGFRYQDIPSVVNQAFVDVSNAKVIDEKKDYKDLLYSVKSTEKFGVTEIKFDVRSGKVAIAAATAPVYDDGQKVFAEFAITVERKQGESVTGKNEKTASFNWTVQEFENLQEITIPLPESPAGSGELFVTVQDRISGVSETRKIGE